MQTGRQGHGTGRRMAEAKEAWQEQEHWDREEAACLEWEDLGLRLECVCVLGGGSVNTVKV